MIFFKYKYFFSINSLASLKTNFNIKICLKKKYNFINNKNLPSQCLSTRLMKKGKFLKIYKYLKHFYYKLMLRNQFKYIPLISNFLFFYNKYNSFKNFDKVLF